MLNPNFQFGSLEDSGTVFSWFIKSNPVPVNEWPHPRLAITMSVRKYIQLRTGKMMTWSSSSKSYLNYNGASFGTENILNIILDLIDLICWIRIMWIRLQIKKTMLNLWALSIILYAAKSNGENESRWTKMGAEGESGELDKLLWLSFFRTQLYTSLHMICGLIYDCRPSVILYFFQSSICTFALSKWDDIYIIRDCARFSLSRGLVAGTSQLGTTF